MVKPGPTGSREVDREVAARRDAEKRMEPGSRISGESPPSWEVLVEFLDENGVYLRYNHWYNVVYLRYNGYNSWMYNTPSYTPSWKIRISPFVYGI